MDIALVPKVYEGELLDPEPEPSYEVYTYKIFLDKQIEYLNEVFKA